MLAYISSGVNPIVGIIRTIQLSAIISGFIVESENMWTRRDGTLYYTLVGETG